MVDGPEPGALITPEGQYAVPTIDKYVKTLEQFLI